MKKEKSGISRLLELAGPKKNNLIFACILSVISSASRLVPFFTICGVIKELLYNYNNYSNININHVYTLIGYTFASALIYGICAFSSSAIAHSAAYDIIYSLRLSIMEKLSRISSGYFAGTTQGAIKKIISDDTEQIEVFIAHHIADIAAAIATPIFTLIYLFIMDWRLALVTLIPILISVFILSFGLKEPRGAQTQVDIHNAKEKMEGTIVEYIHGMPVIKIFNRTLSAFARYENDVTSYVKSIENTAYYFAPKMGAYYAFFGAQLLFLLPTCILLIPTASSYIDFLPIILMFFLIGSGLKEPLENMMQMVIHSKRISEGVSRIDNILNQPELLSNGSSFPKNYSVEFKNVSFTYLTDEAPAIKNISFELPQGTVTGIVGPSGGGKSTLAQLLLRFYDPQQGEIKIDDINIKDIPVNHLMDTVSYVSQDSFLFHNSIENNIRMGNQKASINKVIQAAKNAGIHDVIMSLPNGYSTIIGDENTYLSGGEIQRLSIARVFLKDSPIVILDEATAYSDAENEAKIQKAFATLAKNKTVLIIAHRLKTIENCNKILVISEGKLVQTGSHTELLNSCELYRKMVSANELRDNWTIAKRRDLND